MIDFINLQYYETVYYNLMLLFVVFSALNLMLHSTGFLFSSRQNKRYSLLLFLFILLLMGLRPISYHFGDMGTYYRVFNVFAAGDTPMVSNDFGFYAIMKFFAFFDAPQLFFFTIAYIYIYTLYLASKRWFPNKQFLAFLMLIISFSFWSYGTNGIRNGLSTSILILAFSYKSYTKHLLFFLAFSFHSSALLPISAYYISLLYSKSIFYYFIWILSIFASSLGGSFFENWVVKLGIGQEDKLMTYFAKKDIFMDQFSQSGFRWDFLLYSSIPVLISYYFIRKIKFDDKYYLHLTNTYLISNAFWILVIRASFSNRFAYLSWFMMAIVIIYPFLKKRLWLHQNNTIGWVLLLYFSFTYIMNIFIYK